MATYTELKSQIQALQQQAEQVRRNEISDAIAEIKAKMQEYGITVNELGGSGVKRPKVGRTPVAPKYRDSNSGATWSGRGKEPKWLRGKNRNQFLIK